MQVELFSAERKQVSIETILYTCSLGLIIDGILSHAQVDKNSIVLVVIIRNFDLARSIAIV